jgi:outer membrane receptor for ferrienterochelin and colicins
LKVVFVFSSETPLVSPVAALLPAVLLLAAPAARGAGASGEEVPPGEVVDEIVVTGMRAKERLADATVATELIRREDIVASGARTVGEVLDLHPGLQVERGVGGAGVQLWGLSSEYVMILIDGQPAVGRVSGVLDLDRIPASEVERIEIIKGAASLLYGADALAGVIHIITREAEGGGVQGSAGLRLGHLGSARVPPTADVAAGGMAGLAQWAGADVLNTGQLDAGVAVGGERLRSRLGGSIIVAPSLQAPSGSTARAGHALGSLTNRTTFIASDDHRWDLSAVATRRLSGSTSVAATGAVLDSTNDTETVTVRLGPELTFGDRARLRITGSFDHFRDQYLADQRGAEALDGYQETRETAGELETAATVRLGSQHVLATGLELRGEALQTDRISVAVAGRSRVGAWLQDAWDLPLDRPLTAVGGVRYDRDSLFGSAVSPRVALRHDPHPDVVLRASYGHGFRAPPFKDLYLQFANPSAGYTVVGNPELRPETSRSVTAGVSWTAVDQGRLELRSQAFRNDLWDMIDARLQRAAADGEPARYSYANVARAWTQGLEAGFTARPVPLLGLLGDLALLEARDATRDLPLSGRAPTTITAAARVGRPDHLWKLDVRGSWRAAAPLVVTEGEQTVVETTPARTVLDLVGRWSVLPGLSLSAGVDNLLDSGHPTRDPVPPRWIWGAVDGRFGGRRSAPPDPRGAS